MSKRVTKKQARLDAWQRFHDLVEAVVRAHGGVDYPRIAYAWTVPTRCGPLYLHVGKDLDSNGRQGELGANGSLAVFGRFESPEAVGGVPGVNEYTGKWNFHWWLDRHEVPNPNAVFLYWLIQCRAARLWPEEPTTERTPPHEALPR